MKQSIPLLLFFLIISSGMVLAGTEKNPDITDPSGDSLSPDQATDVTKAWFYDDAKFLNCTIEVVDLNMLPSNATTVLYDIEFTFDKEYSAAMYTLITNEGLISWSDLSYWDGMISIYIGDLNNSIDIDKNRLSLSIPKGWIGDPKAGSVIKRIYIHTQTCVAYGAKSGDTWITRGYVAIPHPMDRAPDKDYATYTFTYVPPKSDQINQTDVSNDVHFDGRTQKIIPGFDMIGFVSAVYFMIYIKIKKRRAL